MKAVGEFIYKSIEKRDGGSFTNERGQAVTYSESYLLKVDENKDGKIDERRLKIPKDNEILVQKFMRLDPYTRVKIEFDVQFYNNNIKVIPVNLVDSNK